jgi:transcriptional regulator
MYLPPSFTESDPDKLYQFILDYSFATVIINNQDELEIAHLPLSLNATKDKLFGHIAKPNPLAKLLQSNQRVKIIFHGPHGYISPTFYPEPIDQVSTWNYAVVHVDGIISQLDPELLSSKLDELQSQQDATYAIDWSNPHISRKLGGIIGFEITISKIIGKFKLSQNRTKDEQDSIIHHLKQSGDTNSLELASYMQKILK